MRYVLLFLLLAACERHGAVDWNLVQCEQENVTPTSSE